MLVTTAPILPSRDFDETSAFYGQIGFRETGRWPDQGYMIIVMDQVELHFFGHPDLAPETNNHGAYVRTDDVDALSAHIATLGLPGAAAPRFHPTEDKPWGMRELALVDLNGNLLRIGEFLSDG